MAAYYAECYAEQCDYRASNCTTPVARAYWLSEGARAREDARRLRDQSMRQICNLKRPGTVFCDVVMCDCSMTRNDSGNGL